MKYCSHCHHWTPGAPLYCEVCGRSYQYRVCTKGHINPTTARFCSQCGSSELSQPSEEPTPWVIRLLKPAMLIFILVGILLFVGGIIESISQNIQSVFAAFIPIGLILLVIFLVPGRIGKVIRKILYTIVKVSFRFVVRIVSGIFSFLFGIRKDN